MGNETGRPENRLEVDRPTHGSATTTARSTAEAVGAVFGKESVATWLEVRLECKQLLNKDIGSDSDPMAVMYEKREDNKWHEVGRTEVISSNLNPSFLKAFEIMYQFHQVQSLKIKIYDVDEQGDPYDLSLSDQDYLGEAGFTLSSLVSSFQGKLELPLWDVEENEPAGEGKVIVRYEQRSAVTEIANFTFWASDLVEQRQTTKPILLISRSQEDGSWAPVYRSESNQDPAPHWHPVEISLGHLCNGDLDRTLKLEVLDFKPSGKHKPLARTEASVRQIQDAVEAHIELQLPRSEKFGGKLWVNGISIVRQPSFLEYMGAQFEICFLVAVDFTASNGMIGFPTSLHHLDPDGKKKNPYQEAITGVGKVLEFYDYDKKFPTWGFGGHLPKSDSRPEGVSHCFALNNKDLAPECTGIEGILEAYSTSLRSVRLAGPTFFSPVINAAIQAASRPVDPPKYYCLLLLTDGVIMDMRNTIRSVIAASRLPLSILIVGVGDEDFKNMELLDADKNLLNIEGTRAERDIVQFVEFNRFKGNGEALASQLLAELPGQFLAYMRKHQIFPEVKSNGENRGTQHDTTSNTL